MMRYWPVASVTAVRTFSISALLLASTVTPGITAPEESLTTPVIEACASAAAGRRNRTAKVNDAYADLRMVAPCRGRRSPVDWLENGGFVPVAGVKRSYGAALYAQAAGSVNRGCMTCAPLVAKCVPR